MTRVVRSRKDHVSHYTTRGRQGPYQVKERDGTMWTVGESVYFFACGLWGRESSVELDVGDVVTCLGCIAAEESDVY